MELTNGPVPSRVGLAQDARQMEPDWDEHHAAHDTKNVQPVVSLRSRWTGVYKEAP